MKILKRKGIRIDPGGKHVLILHYGLKNEPILALCFRLVDSVYLCHNNVI